MSDAIDTSEARAAAAATLWRAWMQDRLIDGLPGDLRPTDPAEGFDVQEELEALAGPRVGWKIAATSAAGQAHIGVQEPLPGRLFGRFVHADGAVLAADHLHMAVVEAELAFRIGRSVHVVDPTRDDVAAAVDAMHLALEVPESRYRAFEVVGAPQLLADNACAGRFVLGREVPDWRSLDLARQRVTVSVGGVAVARGSGANVLGHPLDALAWLAGHLAERGQALRPGDVVTTGTLTEPVPIRAGDEVAAVFDGIGRVSLSFAGQSLRQRTEPT